MYEYSSPLLVVNCCLLLCEGSFQVIVLAHACLGVQGWASTCSSSSSSSCRSVRPLHIIGSSPSQLYLVSSSNRFVEAVVVNRGLHFVQVVLVHEGFVQEVLGALEDLVHQLDVHCQPF